MGDVPRYHRLVSAARRRLAGAMSTMVLLIAVVGVAPAWAVESIVLDQDRVLYGEEGSVHQLAEVPVDADRVGSSCTLQVHTENQFSVHPGNDLLITTGGVQSVIEDVEAEPDADRDLSAAVVLGPVLVVELRFGPHQVSSMGFDLSVECPEVAGLVITQPPTTEQSPVTEVPIPAPTVPATCDTGSAPAGGGQAAGAGSLSLGQDGCGSTTTTAPTTSAPPATPPPTVESTTTTAAPPPSAAAQSTTTTGPTPTVKGLQITRQLPQTPAAAPVQALPAYTG